MNETSKTNVTLGKVLTGGFWLYLNIIVGNIIGYIYWFLIANISGPEIIGYATVTISFATIVQLAITLGIPVGIQRFLGKAFGESNFSSLKTFFLTALILIVFLALLTDLVLFFIGNYLGSLIGLDFIYIFLAAILVFLFGVNMLFKSLLISTLRVDKMFFIDITGTTIRLLTGVYLVYLGLGGIGAAAGFVFAGLFGIFAYGAYSLRMIKNIKHNTPPLNLSVIYDILRAGFANWLPTLITSLGVQLGIIILFGNQGAYETGIYYVAYAIFSILMAIPDTFLGFLFPVLSGIREGHSIATKRTINLVLSFSTPLAAIFATYGFVFLSMMGSAYVSGSFVLAILSLSIPFLCVVNGIKSLVYALGNYKAVLLIGTVASLARVSLYLYLVPIYGSIGTAYSFVSGVFISFLISLFYVEEYNVTLNWRGFLFSTLFPFALGYVLWLVWAPWYIGTILILSVSVFVFARAKIYTKEDLRDIIFALLPYKFAIKRQSKIDMVLKILFGE